MPRLALARRPQTLAPCTPAERPQGAQHRRWPRQPPAAPLVPAAVLGAAAWPAPELAAPCPAAAAGGSALRALPGAPVAAPPAARPGGAGRQLLPPPHAQPAAPSRAAGATAVAAPPGTRVPVGRQGRCACVWSRGREWRLAGLGASSHDVVATPRISRNSAFEGERCCRPRQCPLELTCHHPPSPSTSPTHLVQQ